MLISDQSWSRSKLQFQESIFDSVNFNRIVNSNRIVNIEIETQGENVMLKFAVLEYSFALIFPFGPFC